MIELKDIHLLDLLPQSIKHDANIIACADALDQQLKAITSNIPKLAILSNVKGLSSEWLDALAWQWSAPFYDQSLLIEQKKELVTNALAWHKRRGTPSAVEELVATIFGSGEVIEWWEYGGQPGCFKVKTSDPSATTEKASQFLAAINSVKNVRSWLETVEITTGDEMQVYIGNAVHIGKFTTIRQVV
ncbi:MAG: phage tail protein I [Candidatus Pristimantibacillus sp.]